MIEVKRLNSEELIKSSNEFYPMIEDACLRSQGKYKAEDLFRLIINGNMQLWGIYEDRLLALCITEIAVFPQRKVLRFICATGENADKWVGNIKQIEEWSKKYGCDAAEAICRPGWEKLLKTYDYVKNHVILGKELK